MAVHLLLLLVTITVFAGSSDAAWCVCRSDVSSTLQQKALDYACGAGADCTPITQNGACYNPNTVLAHCSYAVNSYYQRKSQAQGSCDFSGTATLSSTDPGGNGCTYPASSGGAGTPNTTPPITTSTPPSTVTPSMPTLTGTTPTGTTILSPPNSLTPPSSFTPSTGTTTGNGVGGGVLGGLGPSGGTSSSSLDGSDAAFLPSPATVASLFSAILISSLFLLMI